MKKNVFVYIFSIYSLLCTNQVHSLTLHPQLGHTSGISYDTISLNQKWYATGDYKGDIVLWDIEKSAEIRRMHHAGGITGIIFCQNDEILITSSEDGSIISWNPRTGDVIDSILLSSQNYSRMFLGLYGIRSIAISGLNDFIICKTDYGLIYIPIKNGFFSYLISKLKTKVQADLIETDKKGDYFVYSNDSSLYLRKKKKSIAILKEHTDTISSIDFHMDGFYFLSGSKDAKIILWNVNKEKVKENKLPAPVEQVVFLDVQTAAIVTSEQKIYYWNMETNSYSYEDVFQPIMDIPNNTKKLSATDDFIVFRMKDDFITMQRKKIELSRVFSKTLCITSITGSCDSSSLFLGMYKDILGYNLYKDEPLQIFSGHESLVSTLDAGKKYVLSGYGDGKIRLWDINNKENNVFSGHSGEIRAVSLAPDDYSFISGSIDRTFRLWSIQDGEVYNDGTNDVITDVALSPDQMYSAYASLTGICLREPSNKTITPFKRNKIKKIDRVTSITFDPSSKYLLGGTENGEVLMWDNKSYINVRIFTFPGSREKAHTDVVTDIAFSGSGNQVFSSSSDRTIKKWDVKTEELLSTYNTVNPVNSFIISKNDNYLFASEDYSYISAWDIRNDTQIASIYVMKSTPPTIAVIDSFGRFDVDNLENMGGLNWISDKDNMTPFPLEIYMREYYEPRLFQRILAGEELEVPRDITKLNTVQPKIEIIKVSSVKNNPEKAEVIVRCKNNKEIVMENGTKKGIKSGVYDLRLFRDGQLISQLPEVKEEDYISDELGDKTNIDFWRQVYALNQDEARDVTFTVRIPKINNRDKITFSAYAFNEDRVKSRTSSLPFTYPAGNKPVTPEMYIISIGISVTQDSESADPSKKSWGLMYARRDAMELITYIKKGMDTVEKSEKKIEKIISIPLTSIPEGSVFIEPTLVPSKDNIRNIFKILSGEVDKSAKIVKVFPDLGRVEACDIVIVYFSCHGFINNENREFYLVPYDTGKGHSGKITTDLIGNAISSRLLSYWLKKIDSENIALIIDSCYSESAVMQPGFKSGPMGDSGLGQLAYDKKMLVLVAAQEEAGESSGASFLKKALIDNGLKKGKAADDNGYIYLTRLLQYAEENTEGTREFQQEPKLFNYRVSREDIVLKKLKY